ncbi:MAG: hypothetical protein IJU00_14890 [Selenomonas sp.]|nr:hypothetical protein [Selenomonas sp.]
MRYENGKEYKFQFGNVTVLATFEGLTEEVVDKFNRLCASEVVRNRQQQKEAGSYDGNRAYAGTH